MSGALPVEPRKRRVANPTVSALAYSQDLLHVLNQNGMSGSVDTMYGPFVDKSHEVTSANLIRNIALAKQLLRANPDGVLHGARLESAWKLVFAEKTHLVPADTSSNVLAHRATNNLMAVMKVLRTIQKEEQNTTAEHNKWHRRYPKTGALRR
eukprot:537331-Pyramimonas_sp.AAC.1